MKKNRSKTHTNKAPSKAQAKYWNLIETDDSAELQLYGEFVEQRPVDWWTGQAIEGEFAVSSELRAAIDKIKDKANITVRINSCGGEVYTGLAIFNALKELKGHKTAIVEGVAMSAATFPLCACDEVIVLSGSIIMIHGVSTMFWDNMNLQDVEKAAQAMNCMEKIMADIYHDKTGISVDELREKMKGEWWLTPDEAVESGFADTIKKTSATDSLKLVASAGGTKSLYFGNRKIADNFRGQIPSRFGVQTASTTTNKPKTTKAMDEQQIEETVTTLEEVTTELDTALEQLDELTTEEIQEVIEDAQDQIEEAEQTLEEVQEDEATDAKASLKKAKASMRSLRASVKAKASAKNEEGDDDEDSTNQGDPGDDDEEIKNLEEEADREKDPAAKAVAQERLRIAKIDKVAKAMNLDSKLVHRAKYGSKKTTAEALAYRASTSDSSARRQWLNKRRNDSKATAKVKADAGGGKPKPQNKAEKRAKMGAFFKGVREKFTGKKSGK